MLNFEDLQVDDLQEGQRVPFAPNAVGVRHSHFGLIAAYVAFVERVGDSLLAEMSDGRRYEVKHRIEQPGPCYALCPLVD
jgi:hypothetical protein